jgi:hypothetical protein
MIRQRLRHAKLGLGIFFLTFSGYYLPAYLQPTTVLAQPAANQNLGQNQEADRLFQEAEQLVNNEAQFVQAFSKYQQALRLYRQSGDTTRATTTRQRLETVLAASVPLAEKFEQEMDQDEAAFLRQFPKTENNQAANQLEEFAATQLGIRFFGRPGESPWAISESQQKAFEDIHEELTNYLDNQVRNPNSNIDTLPSELQEYLDKNAGTLNALRKLILENESPRWATDMSWISEGDPAHIFTSYLGIGSLQKLIAIDILYKQQQGKMKEKQEVLDASWKFGQSFKNDPLLIGQLVNIITIRYQIGVMRKLDGLPTAWQQRLLEHDYRQSLLQALIGESLHTRAIFRQHDKLGSNLEDFGYEYPLDLGWSEWSEPMRQNFLRWEGIAYYQMTKQISTILPQENSCSFSLNSLRSMIEPAYGDLLVENSWLYSLWIRAGRFMVDLELTQKILQMKEVGSSSQNIPNTQSTICPNANWVYQFIPNDRRSITLEPLPWWAADVRGLPLIHTIDLNRN